MENEPETCELCGRIMAKMHNWSLEAYPLPIAITPRYYDNVLSLCQRCFEYWDEKLKECGEEDA